MITYTLTMITTLRRVYTPFNIIITLVSCIIVQWFRHDLDAVDTAVLLLCIPWSLLYVEKKVTHFLKRK